MLLNSEKSLSVCLESDISHKVLNLASELIDGDSVSVWFSKRYKVMRG